MGIALLAFSSLSQPVRALTQFLARPGRAARDAFNGAPAGGGRTAQHTVSVAAATPGDAQGLPHAASAKLAFRLADPLASTSMVSRLACVLPPTTLPKSAGASAFASVAVQSVRTVAALPVGITSAANADWFHGASSTSSQPRSATKKGPMLRVLRRLQASDPAKLVISGRMADVCAELDRLAASESALAV